LPDPATFENPQFVAEINLAVSNESSKISSSKKRGNYGNYDDELRSKIARFAKENGDAAAVRTFSKELGRILNESTVRTWRKHMIKMESAQKSQVDLMKDKKGRPLLIGNDLDKRVSTICFSIKFKSK
jgi:hypothetical protein